MDPEVNAQYRWTLDEYLLAQRYHFRLSLNTVAMRVLHGAFGILLLAGAVYLFLGYWETDEPFYLTFAGAWWFVWWFVLWRMLNRYFVRYRYQKLPPTHKDIEMHWEFGPERVHVRTSLGTSDFTWASYGKVVLTPKGLVCYVPGTNLFNWAPKHAFASDADFEQVVAWAKAKVAKFKTLG